MEMEGQGLVGLEARAGDGTEIGRIREVITDEETGEVTHVVVETGEEVLEEFPITDLLLDRDADFAAVHADPSDEEPGDHVGDDVEETQGYAPNKSFEVPDDRPHEGQFVAAPGDEHEAASISQEASTESGGASNWQDEDSTTFASGYPRNDAYIDPDTGMERERYPEGGEDIKSDASRLLDGTELEVREVIEGVVVLEGSIASQEDLDEVLAEITDIDGVLDVDTTEVDIG